MQRMTRLAMLATVVATVWGGVVSADTFSPRQYYSDWRRPAQGNYYVRNYYCKPNPQYAGYRVHEVRYFPAKPDHYYYFNPRTKKYWGRCPSHCEGKPLYSLLEPDDRHADLAKIPESAFPPPGKLPAIPESDPQEGASLDLPPEDAPPIGAGPSPAP